MLQQVVPPRQPGDLPDFRPGIVPRMFLRRHATVTVAGHAAPPGTMKSLGHLRVAEIKLPPGEEWADAAPAWRFVRIDSGAAYWLGSQSRTLGEGETLLLAPAVKSVIRASQLSGVRLQGFGFMPELVCGFFTLAENKALAGVGPTDAVRFLPSTHPVAQYFATLAALKAKSSSLAQRVQALSLVAALLDEDLIHIHPFAGTLGLSALQRFRQVVVAMSDVEITRHTPEELARLCGCSLRHFNRIFRRQFGDSFRHRREEVARQQAEAWSAQLQRGTAGL